ncbi:MAG: 7-cyano-7-deazaguanine synthase QueC [bacterium (Candidatus Ratteibacteria) CG_4_10_14_3_um_filter_41_18]|uniref:7-cyano-7-deazaguanine synthase n=3 Tax=Candidatus Ratteibacteria TaxID=2979319 RepID=A0A2M7YDT2_9BACT|nr:MAG: 7-cyano-7-deazaguanine synthase QueC [Candidatus Omnitrophica bacterium CG1_02_41_171]PIW31741.1 MAG: 7-cyano-7-deazaguanine synthase QueC [bacterium (Candidatus Ratteibacteria) CG15_BIG_FIL_POST_REV_8_21_14_020_41_12]PIX77220.1 MAG: 7-cyano-7-deazaguanine synthase QueC [bacterium (Candidatus Ratteibacteria) CG_4_10_14_3_um_filter_41_18]PJA61128.1 MAG: 7-cyano-7-deazaguanine synthase QueC [bacterium (Candidatus Ratteibacteria) CG_4_9_14_3_um_filter_41_21]
MKKAIILLSGGIDSSTTLYLAKSQGYQPTALIFDYHQRHKKEIESAKKIAKSAPSSYKLVKISFPEGGSSLLDPNLPLRLHPHLPPGASLPSRGRIEERGREKIPFTYVPARNIIFLSYALSCAETWGSRAIFIGANQVDYSGYPDCRASFIAAFNRMVKEGTKSKNIKVIAPLMKMNKGEIIKLGMKLGVPYHLTWSCYEGKEKPCLKCDSCKFRLKGFREAGITDPLLFNHRGTENTEKKLPRNHEI